MDGVRTGFIRRPRIPMRRSRKLPVRRGNTRISEDHLAPSTEGLRVLNLPDMEAADTLNRRHNKVTPVNGKGLHLCKPLIICCGGPQPDQIA